MFDYNIMCDANRMHVLMTTNIEQRAFMRNFSRKIQEFMKRQSGGIMDGGL